MQVGGLGGNSQKQREWPIFLRKSALSLACLLLSSAGACWVAANWERASALQKLAGAQILLAIVIMAAAWAAWRRKTPQDHNFSLAANLAGLAAVATGALLALVGQIYQTGADNWQLFLLWAALLLPWILVMKTVFMALLLALLLNISLALYLYLVVDGLGLLFSFLAGGGNAYVMAMLDALLLLAWERSVRPLGDRWRIGPRILLAAAAGWAFAAVLSVGFDGGSVAAMALPGLLLMGLCYFAYTRLRPDLVAVALTLAGAFLLVAAPLVLTLDSTSGLLGIVLVLAVLALLGVRHLSTLVRAARQQSAVGEAGTAEASAIPIPSATGPRAGATPSDAAANAPAQPAPMDAKSGPAAELAIESEPAAAAEPWFVSLFRLVAVGLVALLLLAFLAVTLDIDEATVWVLGVVLAAIGTGLHRATKIGIVSDFGTIFLMAGIVLFPFGLFEMELEVLAAVAALLAFGAAIYLSVPLKTVRFVAALVLLGTCVIVTWPGLSRWDFIEGAFSGFGGGLSSRIYLYVWWLAAATALALAGTRTKAGRAFWSPLAWALLLLAQYAAWMAPIPQIAGLREAPWAFWVMWLACALLPPLALWAFLTEGPGGGGSLPRRLRVGAPLALTVASLGWLGAPGISLSVLWILFGYFLGRRLLVAFGVAALLAYLYRFYYLLDASLLQKSAILAMTGGWLLLSWAVLRRLVGPRAPGHGAGTANRSLGVPAGLLAGLLVVLAVANTMIYQRERIQMEGQRIVLALAPVDPRSLMQGDYMALGFEVANEASARIAALPDDDPVRKQRGGYLLLRPGADGVSMLVAVAPEPPDSNGGDVALSFTLRDGRVRLSSSAWFFPEGQAARYAQARYGVFRVDDNGDSLIVGLLDAQQKPLGPQSGP